MPPGPLDGAPTREMNKHLVRDLVERYGAGTNGTVVVDPHIEIIESPWTGPEAEAPTRLPSVFVRATFVSGSSVGPAAADSSGGFNPSDPLVPRRLGSADRSRNRECDHRC